MVRGGPARHIGSSGRGAPEGDRNWPSRAAGVVGPGAPVVEGLHTPAGVGQARWQRAKSCWVTLSPASTCPYPTPQSSLPYQTGRDTAEDNELKNPNDTRNAANAKKKCGWTDGVTACPWLTFLMNHRQGVENGQSQGHASANQLYAKKKKKRLGDKLCHR